MLKDLENMFLKYTNMGEKLQKKKILRKSSYVKDIYCEYVCVNKKP